MKDRLFLLGALILMGAGWGITVPLAKIAVSTGHQPFGLIFWQLVVVVAVLAGVTMVRGKPFVFKRKYLRLFAIVALFGALLPDAFFYAAAVHLPAGILSILLASEPLISLPIALCLGTENFAWQRMLGLSLGMGGIVLLIGPEASLPKATMTAYVFLALLAPLSYALEGNLVGLWGTQGLDAVQTLLGASVLAAVLALPLAFASGQWINPLMRFGPAETALVASAVIHAFVYAGYVWLIGRAGPVFAAQLSYLVNGFGVLWAMILLGETYSAWVWAALALMTAGVALVQPQRKTG